MPSASAMTPGAMAVRDTGAAVMANAVSADLLESLQRRSRDLLRSEHALAFPKSTRVWDLYRHGPPFLELLTLPLLRDAVTALLGEYALLSDYSLNCVQPRQPRDDWHLDYPFNEMPSLLQGGLLGLQCVFALDEFTVDNGATEYVPGSHRPARRPEATAVPEFQTATLTAGSMLIMAASTWHRSGFNTTSGARSAILLSFVERWIRPMTDPPEPGAWSTSHDLRLLLGMERPPETINGVPIDGSETP